MLLQAQVGWQRNSEQTDVLTGGDDVCTQFDGWGTSTKFRQTMIGAAPDEFSLVHIEPETIGWHPVIYVCGDVFKPPNSRRRVLATTA